MSWAIGDTYPFRFQTKNSSGVPTDADSTPTGVLYVNQVATAATVTITDSGTGWYRGSVSLAGLTLGDVFAVEVTAIIGGVTHIQSPGDERISFTADGVSESVVGGVSKLAAVNRVLRSVGIPPVTALDTGGTTEEAEAETILDESINEVMSKGWSCNTADERTLSPSGGEIDMSGILQFSGSKYGDEYAIKNGKLYDPINDTDSAFTADVVLTDVVFQLSFDQIPEIIQKYIIAHAQLEFVRYKRQDIAEDRRYAAKLEEQKRAANVEDDRIKNVNLTQMTHALLARGYPKGRRR